MEKPDLQWLAWALIALLLGSLVWRALCRFMCGRTLKTWSTPLGARIYTWKDPLGFQHTSRTHPGIADNRGDGGFGGGDWGDGGGGDGGGGD